MEHRFILLETKISYQEKTIAELNDVLIEQQTRLSEIANRLKALEALLERGGATEDSGTQDPGTERPPHY
jgi:SlyX protein